MFLKLLNNVREGFLSWLLPFKIVTSSLDALAKSRNVAVHCSCPVSLRNLANFMVNRVLEQGEVGQAFSLGAFLQKGKEPVIWGGISQVSILGGASL